MSLYFPNLSSFILVDEGKILVSEDEIRSPHLSHRDSDFSHLKLILAGPRQAG